MAHEYCKDCPGPEVFKLKAAELEKQVIVMCKGLKEVRENLARIKNWAIGNLVTLCFLLIGVIMVFVRQQGGGISP